MAYGVRVGIRVSDPAVLGQLARFLPPSWKPASSPVVDALYSLVVGSATPKSAVRRFNILYSGATRLARTFDLEEALRQLELDLHSLIARMARHRIFLRAGVVGWEREAIVIPGSRWSGKSTLVAALMKAGAVYYSDQFAVLDSRGRVHPYPVPVVLSEYPDGKPKKISLESLGWKIGTKPLPVGFVLMTEYKRGAHWQPRVLSFGETARELLMSTVPTDRQPELALNALSSVASRAVFLKGLRGEAEEVIEFLTRGQALI